MSVAAIFGIIVAILSMTRTSPAVSNDASINSFNQCEEVIKEIEKENHAMNVDESSSRLHYTWVSQQCEMRPGQQYILRKYTFYKNGTFLLLRYHYAEESCSMPTHTVIIRGAIKLLKASKIISGATEAKFHVDAVNIIPLTLEVTQKFGQKLNQSCGPQPKWRLYTPALIFEQPRQHSTISVWQSPNYNSLQAINKQLGMHCLELFGIEFTELKLLSVQNKIPVEYYSSNDARSYEPHFQLLLANPVSNVHLRRNYKPTSLQSTALIRHDSMTKCPICNSVFQSTEANPPLLHQSAALPAMIGGIWHSERCESSTGGLWSRRKFQIYSGDKLWIGHWDYYEDPHCTKFLYGIRRIGSYVQQAERQNDEEVDKDISFADYDFNTTGNIFKRSVTDTRTIHSAELYQNSLHNKNGPSKDEQFEDKKARRQERSMADDDVYQFVYDAPSTTQSRFAAMMRGHQTYETTTRKPFFTPNVLTGTTELDLHIVKNALIPRDPAVPVRCDNKDRFDLLQTSLSRNCVPRAVETLSSLQLRAKLEINWHGQPILLLTSRDGDHMWDAPLRRCTELPPYNPSLRMYLQKILYIGLFSSENSASRISDWFLLPQLLLCYIYYYLVW